MERVWTWRDSGNHGALIKAFNLAAGISGYSRRPFVAEQLIEKARRRTGLDDLGASGFHEGLEQLCRSFSADRQLNGLGHFAATEMIVSTLANRLRVVDWIKHHPRVEDEIIDRPWIITGITRSGTTLGSHLLDLDVNNRSPLHWQCDHPAPPAMLATQYSDPRIAQCVKVLAQVEKLFPSLKAMHPMAAHLAQECGSITQLDFQSIFFHGIAPLPEYTDWHLDSDKHSTYRLHKQVLQIWQSAIPTAHWSLKAPSHMFAIDEMMQTYPDARLLWSHRDPVVCIASHTSLALNFMRAYNIGIDHKKVATGFSKAWLAGIQKMMRYDRARSDKHWCKHVHYNDLIKDPVATIGAAYRHFGAAFDSAHQRRIEAWVQQRPQNKFGRHEYSLDDFGLDAKEIRRQYAEYIDTYAVPQEKD